MVGTVEGVGSTQNDAVGGVLGAEEARELVEHLSFGRRERRSRAWQNDEERGTWVEGVALGEKALDAGGASEEAIALVQGTQAYENFEYVGVLSEFGPCVGEEARKAPVLKSNNRASGELEG